MTTSFTAQVGFRGRDDSQALNSSTFNWAQNTNWTQDTGVVFRIRFEVEEQNNKTEVVGWVLESNYNGTGWATVTASSTYVQAVASAQFNEGDATTNLLTASAKTFVAGEGVEDGSGTGLALQNTHSEYEYALQWTGSVVDGQTCQFRIATLDGYTVTPTVTVNVAPQTVEETASANRVLDVTSVSGVQVGNSDSENRVMGISAKGGKVYEETLYDTA